MLAFAALCDCCQRVDASRDEHEVEGVGGGALGEISTDAARRAGDEAVVSGGLPAEMCGSRACTREEATAGAIAAWVVRRSASVRAATARDHTERAKSKDHKRHGGRLRILGERDRAGARLIHCGPGAGADR